MLKKALFLILFIPLATFAGKLDRIKKAIDGGDYTKAQELIVKASEKEPNNPGISYFQAFLYQTPTFQHYDLDSARITIDKAITDFEKADEKSIANLNEDGIRLELTIKLQTSIRDKQFLYLLSDVSIETMSTFRAKYPGSVYDDMLEFKQDSIVFLNVKEIPSIPKISQFIAEYSTSIFLPEAKKILDQLNYQELKRNGKLPAHYQFLVQYPLTNFRKQVEAYILRYSTLDHSPESYLAFLALSGTESLKRKAANLLYYTSDERGEFIEYHPDLDSISHAFKTSDLALFPVIDRGKFGFATSTGQIQIEHQYTQVEEHDKCQLITDDWVFVQKEDEGFIIDKMGNKIIDKVEQYSNLGNGAALVSQDGSTYLYHKSGFKILNEPIDGAEVLQKRWIKVKEDEKSKLVSFLGVPITETQYDDIYLKESFWVFEKRGLLAVYTEGLIADELHKKGLSLEFKFDDIELIREGMFIGFREGRECLIDQQLNFLIPWGNYLIYPDDSGWYLKLENGYQIYNSLEKEVLNRQFPYLESNNGWLALKTKEDWMLLPRKEGVLPSRGYDSLKLINDFIAFTLKEDQSQVIFNDGSTLAFEQDAQIKTFPNSNFISITNNTGLTIYNENGKSIITGRFDQVSFLNDSLLKVEVKNKQGLMTVEGEYILRPIFDLIDQQNEMIFLLQDNKIGCFDLNANVIFMPRYEARLEKIGSHYTAKLNGKYGLIDLEEKQVLDFSYDEISYWNDSTFKVKKENYYDLINYSEESKVSKMELMNKLTSIEGNEIWKFVKSGKYGLLSTEKGIILEPEFSDIFNIGTAKSPLFFADQHLDKAGFHVVSYVNQEGELILSKAYTTDEFDLILCED